MVKSDISMVGEVIRNRIFFLDFRKRRNGSKAMTIFVRDIFSAIASHFIRPVISHCVSTRYGILMCTFAKLSVIVELKEGLHHSNFDMQWSGCLVE